MLILTRRIGEVLVIGEDVQLTVLGVRGHQVRIGVDAPKHVGVHRKEVYERMKDNTSTDDSEKKTKDSAD